MNDGGMTTILSYTEKSKHISYDILDQNISWHYIIKSLHIYAIEILRVSTLSSKEGLLVTS